MALLTQRLIPSNRRTPGAWRVGKTTGAMRVVVAESPVGATDCDVNSIGFYGGYLIAESITPANADAIALTSDMFDVLEHPGFRSVTLRWVTDTDTKHASWRYVVSIAVDGQRLMHVAGDTAVDAIVLAAREIRKAVA